MSKPKDWTRKSASLHQHADFKARWTPERVARCTSSVGLVCLILAALWIAARLVS
jgi:hypothetical protein